MDIWPRTTDIWNKKNGLYHTRFHDVDNNNLVAFLHYLQCEMMFVFCDKNDIGFKNYQEYLLITLQAIKYGQELKKERKIGGHYACY